MARSLNLTKVEGIPELAKAIEKLQKKVSGDEVRKVLMAGAMEIRDEARERAPEDTGRLKRNVIATYGKNRVSPKDEIDVLVGVKYGKDGGNHAHLIEFGTSKMPAQPFFRPAVQSKKSDVAEIITDGLKNIIEEKS